MFQREAMERPARRRGIADSESGSSVSSDSDADVEPPTKKKSLALVCLLLNTYNPCVFMWFGGNVNNWG